MTKLGRKLRTGTSLRTKALLYFLSHALVFLLGVVIVQVGGSRNVAIGTSLVAAGIAGWILGVYALFSERLSRRLEALTEFGFVEAFTARSARIRETYDGRLNDVREHVDLLGFGQSAFRQDYQDQFAVWAQRRVEVRILLLDPDFPTTDASLADQRDGEEQNPVGSIRRDVDAFLAAVEPLLNSSGGRFRVRLYRCLPTVNVFRIDDELFWGPYLMHEQSRNSPTFLVDRGGHLYDRLLGHFEAIWSSDELSRNP